MIIEGGSHSPAKDKHAVNNADVAHENDQGRSPSLPSDAPSVKLDTLAGKPGASKRRTQDEK